MKEHHTQEYWELHKTIWQKEFDELDKDIQNHIYRDPHGREARGLEKRVKRELYRELKCQV